MDADSRFFKSRIARIAALAGTAIAALVAPSSARAQTIDLAGLTPDRFADDFDLWRTGAGAPGEWKIVADPTAPGGRALAQVSTDRTSYRFPLAIYRAVVPPDVEARLRFKPVAGQVDQAGGIAVRLLSFENYYVARANALENNVRLYRVIKGKREQIAGADVPVTANEWHTIVLRAEGDRLAVSYDGRALFTATDQTFAEPGKVALWTKADSVTYFDRLDITALP